jgi:hypothetical protein
MSGVLVRSFPSYLCNMRRFFTLLCACLIFCSGCGLQAAGKTCRMAKDGQAKNCPCTSKKEKKKCCKTGLKPLKHLNSSKQSSKYLHTPDAAALQFQPFRFCFHYSETAISFLQARPASHPPDYGPPLHLKFRNIRC